MREILLVYNICLTHHTQILYGKHSYLTLAKLVHTRTDWKDGNAQVFADEIFYCGDVVHFQYYIEIIDGFVDRCV